MMTSMIACLGLVLYLGVIPSNGFHLASGTKLVRSRFPHEGNRWYESNLEKPKSKGVQIMKTRVHHIQEELSARNKYTQAILRLNLEITEASAESVEVLITRCLGMTSVLKEGDIFWAKELRKGMHYRQLGKSDLVVSEVCLGTMTWGEQNSDEEAFDQLNLAYDEFGVNFIDTAEIYPVPTKAETQGRTELALGKWLKTRTRDDVVVATKVAGRSDRLKYLRDSGEGTRVRRKDILEAVDKSLKRLGTDYIDLLQIHWPDRNVPLFGTNGRYDVTKEHDDDISFEEQLAALDEVVKAGKVRFIGTSNDTPYGVVKMAQIGERMGYPRVASVQNNYSLLVRADTELGSMPEVVSRQNADVGFLAYSPLAGGVLTGKYENTEEPMPDARLNRFQGFMSRYLNSDSSKAIKKYAEIAEMIGLTPTQLALAWVYSREFVTSTIIGATNVVQLRDNLRSLNCPVTQPAYEAIHKVYDEFRDPTKQKR